MPQDAPLNCEAQLAWLAMDRGEWKEAADRSSACGLHLMELVFETQRTSVTIIESPQRRPR